MDQRDMTMQELATLRTIAETLNESTELGPMLEVVLEKLLELTGLKAAWLFLVEEGGGYEFAAGSNLPPGLCRNGGEPMRCGNCWCLNRYREGRLNNAVNIMNCKRIEQAKASDWGDTQGITHHATVPLRSGCKRLGVLNVAAPGKLHFDEAELALLQAVALQIGSAIERTRLYAAEQRRASLFAKLGEYGAALGVAAARGGDRAALWEQAMALVGRHFDWPCAALLMPSGGDMAVRAIYADGRTFLPQAHAALDVIDWYGTEGGVLPPVAGNETARRLALWLERQGLLPHVAHAATAPVASSGMENGGVLLVGYDKPGELYRVDAEVIEALAELIGVTFERARLEESRRELARMEERNRLARDLHDSVSQTLFSLAMMSKGAASLLGSEAKEPLQAALEDMQSLSQSALKEMRELIMQLRPAGLEEGLATGLKQYGERLKLRVTTRVSGVMELPRAVEEALWRIGQEALNNISKHSGTPEADVVLVLRRNEVSLTVADRGPGITQERLLELKRHSLGLSTMRERAEALGGRFALRTFAGGTAVEAVIPLNRLEITKARRERER
ncbi:GAF domain-containing sensor histidine kinase [Paenibacillus thailandensis]|uniref:histidine kinase n=1 Tax=Paenibacillus thailandensis TaxID=393250 RepID=A0ABW5QV11_9BACL